LKQGEVSDYLGIKIERKPDGTLEWTQPTLTQSILKDLKLDGEEIKGKQNKPNVKAVPANTKVPLTDHKDSADHNQKEFDYIHVIGKLLYLEKSTRPDISCAVHQCARHCANPKIQHTAAVKRIGRHTYGLMPSEQQMIVETMHQQMRMTHVQCQDSVRQQVCQQSRTNITLDVLHMCLKRSFKITRK